MNTPTTLPITEVKPNPDNPRTIKDDKFKKLVQSLKDFPEMADVREIVVNKDHVILGGNMRYKAMKEAGWKQIPVRVVDWSEEKQKEFIVKDNVSGGEWDWDVLANQYELEELDAWGLDLPKDLGQEEVEEDEAPEINPDETKSELGGVYQLGRHKIMCGSATDEDQVNSIFGEQRLDLYLTDPPYNVAYNDDSAANLKARRRRQDTLTLENDRFDDPEEFRAFLADAYRRADEHMKSGAAFYIFHADAEGYNFRGAVQDVGWLLKQNLVWKKSHMVMGRQDYHWHHEPILYGWKSGASHSWYSDRKQTTILEFERPTKSIEHPTMKPINILGYLIQNSSKAGDIVFDSFLGSGSTLIACEQLDRTCYGMELDPKYVDVIRKRYAKFTNNNELPENWEELTPCL